MQPFPFSNRTAFESSENAIARHLARRRARGIDVIDLTESNPTSQLDLCPEAGFWADCLSDPRGARYAPDPCGLPETREAIARDMATRGIELSPERIIVTASTSEAYAFLFKLLADPGDRVLVPAPSYPLFEFLAGLESLHLDFHRLAYDGEWFIDFDVLEEAITPRTRALVAVNPGNPTGAYLKRAELDRLSALCVRRNLALICDEVFFDYALDAPRAEMASALEDCEGDCLRFVLSGLSKSALAPQIKVGWIAARGPEAQVVEAMRRLEVTSDAYLSASTPAQLAVPRILGARCSIQAPLQARLRANLDALHHLWRERSTAAWQPLRTEGGWNAVLRLPRTRSEERWVLSLLDEAGVLVHPGFFFDFPEEAFVTVSLLIAPDLFLEGMRRLDEHIARMALE
ncbi:MAG: pyridoxal phosphate-dependent aminotransferase [Myxococcales bacterium]|jgi:aspartate/methionine/tyrosine aminotransferase|nr:pyridoxal phosphate-dependent aminotransferase [Myxococcales bacterium]